MIIQGIDYKVPPVGKVKNVITGKNEKRPIITSSSKKEKQVWIRTELPKDYQKRSQKKPL